MTEMLTHLETIARETHKTESEVMTLAIETGVRQLWREHILGRYLRVEISRDEAIKSVGIEWVELAERQRQAVMEDITWALGK